MAKLTNRIMRMVLLMAAIVVTGSVRAQVTIGGHRPFLDAASGEMLFVTDSASIGQLRADVVATADSAWTDIRIDGRPAGLGFDFGDMTQNRLLTLTATTADGTRTVSRRVHFTSLPVLSITKDGAFTDDYAAAVISYDGLTADTTFNCMIKHRGGTTNQPSRHKRNYKFKVVTAAGKSQDYSFLGMRNDNGWILDAGQVDRFRLRNQLCHQLWLDCSTKPYYAADEPEMLNGCRGRTVELFINGEYRGVYNLMEPLDRKQLKLKKYDETKGGVRGLLYKATGWQGTTFGMPLSDLPAWVNASATWGGWEAKYPEPGDDADSTDYAPLADFIRFMTTATDEEFQDSVALYVDLPVYRDYRLFANLINGIDNVAKNIYWSIYDNTKAKKRKLVLTPWDMDATFGGNYVNPVTLDSTYIRPDNALSDVTYLEDRLSQMPAEQTLLEQRYAQLRATFFKEEALQARFTKAYEQLNHSGAAQRESLKWSGDTDLGGRAIDYPAELAYINGWIKDRLVVTDRKYGYDPTGIIAVHADDHLSVSGPDWSQPVYNIQGMRVGPAYRGIVISRGHKYVH